jgi:hypothetical protein
MVALIVDHSRSGALEWLRRGREALPAAAAPRRGRVSPRWGAGAAALAVTLAALGPVVAVLAPNLPLTVQPVTVPHWFESAARHLPPGEVLLTYPFASADSQTAIPWQAIGGMHFQMVGGGGPAGTVARAGRNKTAFNVLSTASVALGPAPSPTLANLEAVRVAMRNWGVSMVVVPDDTGLATFQKGRGTDFGVAFFTAVLGGAPLRQDDAWVWPQAERRPPPVSIRETSFDACLSSRSGPSPNDDPWARCVLQSPAAPMPSGSVR